MMEKKKQILKQILHLGLLEIRTLASRKTDVQSRIWEVSNFLHNIPDALSSENDFDLKLLKEKIEQYEKKYEGDSINYLEFFK